MPRLIRTRSTLLVLAVLLGLLLCDRTTSLLGSGSVAFSVRIESDTPIRDASVEAFWKQEPADFVAQNLWPGDLRGEPVTASGLKGEAFEVRVKSESRTSGLGLQHKLFHYRYLAVVAVLADGRRVGKVVELPDARESREVTVRLD